MREPQQPATGYDSALGTLQLIFENSIKGKLPSKPVDLIKYVAYHFGQHMKCRREQERFPVELRFLSELRKATSGSRSHLNCKGKRPSKLQQTPLGWCRTAGAHYYEGGCMEVYTYSFKRADGKLTWVSVRCTVDKQFREWTRLPLAGGKVFHFARGDDPPENCWLNYDGFLFNPFGFRVGDQLLAIARFDPERYGINYDVMEYDRESPFRTIKQYSTCTDGIPFNMPTAGTLCELDLGEDQFKFNPYAMVVEHNGQYAHDSQPDADRNLLLADMNIHFEYFAGDMKRDMTTFLATRAWADEQRLERAFREWRFWVDSKDGPDPARAAKRLREDLAAYKEDGF